MADQKLSQLAVITALANSDLIYVIDPGSKGISWASLQVLIDALVSANTDVVTNTAKITNATHTIEVTGSGALTVQPILITGKTAVTPLSGDFLLISDTSDGGNFKKIDISNLLLKAIYDPTNVSGDAFLMDNMVETATKKVLTDAERTSIASAEQTVNKSAVNGYASLDGGGKVPASELPSSVIGGIRVIGTWNANTNVPDLSSLTQIPGEAFMVSVAGGTNLNGETNWKVKDLAVWDNVLVGNWFKMDNTDDVLSVNGNTGVVVLVKADVGLGNADNTSDADKPVSTATQSALDAKTSAASNITDNAIVRGDGGAKGVQQSGVLVDDSDNITGINNITANDYKGGFAWYFNFQDLQEEDNIRVNYPLTIDSVDDLAGTPTTTILVNDAAYTLGAAIASGDKIKVSVSIASNIALNITKT